eukprot:scaffold3664_cov407-Prasinococcus_capsulatus_cf.AAC.14
MDTGARQGKGCLCTPDELATHLAARAPWPHQAPPGGSCQDIPARQPDGMSWCPNPQPLA